MANLARILFLPLFLTSGAVRGIEKDATTLKSTVGRDDGAGIKLPFLLLLVFLYRFCSRNQFPFAFWLRLERRHRTMPPFNLKRGKNAQGKVAKEKTEKGLFEKYET